MRPDLETLVNEAADALVSALRHYGPGAHPGTGTEQEVHAGAGGAAFRTPRVPLSEADRKSLAANGVFLHGSDTRYDKARLGGHGAYYLSDPGDRPDRMTQAEHIAGGPFGGYLLFLTIDQSKAKPFEPSRDAGARAIFQKVAPDLNPLFAIPYEVVPDFVGPVRAGGYNVLPRVHEPSIQGESVAVLDVAILQVLADTPFPATATTRHYGPGAHPGTGTEQEVHAGEKGGLRQAVADSLSLFATPERFAREREETSAWIDWNGRIHAARDHDFLMGFIEREFDLPPLPFHDDRIRRFLTDVGMLRMSRISGDIEATFYDASQVSEAQVDTLRILAGLTGATRNTLGLWSDLPGVGVEDSDRRNAEARRVRSLIGGDLENVLAWRHYGPGAHPGTGTEQQVHAGDGGGAKRYGVTEPSKGTGDWIATRTDYERRLADKYGMAEPGTIQATSVAWIGPRGWLIAPEGDHQGSAMWLMGKGDVDLTTSEGIKQSIYATDEVVNAGMIRVNAGEPGGVGFDLPGDEGSVTDEQWSMMAALLTQTAFENAEVPPLTITFGGPFGRNLPLGEPGAKLPPRFDVREDEAYRMLDMDREFLRAVASGEFGKDSVSVRGALRRLHYGPGAHPGTGTEQEVHAGGGGQAKKATKSTRFSPGTRFLYRAEGAYRYEAEATSFSEALTKGNGDAYVVDPDRALAITVLVQDKDRSGLPDDVDFEAEMDRVLDAYDHMRSVLSDPANSAWLERVDQDGDIMRERVLRYAEQREQGRGDARMSMNIVFTNNKESSGAGSGGDYAAKVFWVPTTLDPAINVLETKDTGFSFGTSPVYVAIHELHHAWGSGSELDTFSTVVAADYLMNNRELLTPHVERDMVHDLWTQHFSAAARASGRMKDVRLEARAGMGWLYSRQPDYLNDIFARLEADEHGEDNLARQWLANPAVSRDNLGRWAKANSQ